MFRPTYEFIEGYTLDIRRSSLTSAYERKDMFFSFSIFLRESYHAHLHKMYLNIILRETKTSRFNSMHGDGRGDY